MHINITDNLIHCQFLIKLSFWTWIEYFIKCVQSNWMSINNLYLKIKYLIYFHSFSTLQVSVQVFKSNFLETFFFREENFQTFQLELKITLIFFLLKKQIRLKLMGNWAGGMSTFLTFSIFCVLYFIKFINDEVAIKFDYSLLLTGIWWYSGYHVQAIRVQYIDTLNNG